MQRPRPTPEWEKNHPSGKAMLAWTEVDYDAWGIEPPDEVLSGKTEGEAMSEEEIAAWLKDSIATIRIMYETDKLRARELHEGFKRDIVYLASLDKFSDEMQDFALDERNFKWYDAEHE